MYEAEEAIKTFTVSEARSLLPRVRKLMKRISAQRGLLKSLNSDIERARKKANHDGGSVFGATYLVQISKFGKAVREVENLGVQIKDYDAGLIDFPCEYEGRIVLLCWKIGEEGIAYWHEIEAGFAGRQRLTDEFSYGK